MKKLKFKTSINAPGKKVWDTMLDPESYKEWANAAWPGAYIDGQRKQGENIKILSPGYGGTMANIVEFRPYEFSFAKHIAAINPDLTEDRTSEVAKGWIGTTESYTFTEKNGVTTVVVEIETYPAWESEFNKGWPVALAKLKEVCEK